VGVGVGATAGLPYPPLWQIGWELEGRGGAGMRCMCRASSPPRETRGPGAWNPTPSMDRNFGASDRTEQMSAALAEHGDTRAAAAPREIPFPNFEEATMDRGLNGRVAMIAAASRGLGKGVATALAEEGP